MGWENADVAIEVNTVQCCRRGVKGLPVIGPISGDTLALLRGGDWRWDTNAYWERARG